MIHVLDFDGNIVDFFSKEDESVIEAKHLINVQDDIETFDFTVISDRGEFVRERNRIVAEISPNKFREFIIIKTVDEMDGYTEVNCVGSHLEDISKSKPIEPTVLKKLTLDQTMYELLRGTGWKVGDIAFLGDKTYTVEKHISPFEVLKEIKTIFGHEYEFEVKIEDNKIVERKVNCVLPNSVFNGREIVYGKDLVGMTRTVDTENVVTAYLVIGPEYAPNKRLVAEVTDKSAQDKFGIKGDYLWGILEVDDEQARKGVPPTTTTTTTKKPTTTTTTTKKLYTRATTKVVGIKTHTVRKGETLYTIAQKYNVTQQSIKDANKLRSSTVKAGQRLKIVITVKVTTTTTRSTTKKPVTTTTTTIMQQVEQNGIIANLKKIGQREIDKVNQASLSYEVTSLDIRKQYPHEVINIGDKVRIKNRDFKPALYADARVIEIEKDIIADEETYKFGSIKEYSETSLRAYFNSLQKKFEQKLDDSISNVGSIIENKLENTEIFERSITKSNVPPESPEDGTLWYDTSNPDIAVIREYRDGQWVGATAEDISQIGGMTTEQIAFGQLMQLYGTVVGEMNGLENSYNELLVSEYLDNQGIKDELLVAYNLMQDIFLSVTGITTSIQEETVTMDELDNLNNELIEYKYTVTEFYMLIEKAKKYIQEKLKILQSQYSDEKFYDAMDKVAMAIDGSFDRTTGQLTANIPNQEQINKVIQDLRDYTNGQDSALKSNIETTITNKITDTETEFGRQFNEITQKIEGIEIGGVNLLKNTNKEYPLPSREYLQTEDLAVVFDKYPMTQKYSLSFDMKATKQGNMQVYMQNGSGTKYNFVLATVLATTEYQRFKFEGLSPIKQNNNETKAMLAFYGTYDSGVFPIVRNIKLELGTKATDYTVAPEDISNEISNSVKNLNDYKQYIETTFKDGILTDSEYVRLKTLSNEIDKDKLDITTNVTELNNNTSLTGTLKTTLMSLQTTYVNAHKTLQDNMASVISDKSITPTENTLINNNLASYNTALSNLNTHIQKCLSDISDNIAKSRSTEAVDGIEVGGRNLLRDSKNINFAPNATGTGKATQNSDMSWTVTSDVGKGISIYRFIKHTNAGINKITKPFEIGKKYILSIEVIADKDTDIEFYSPLLTTTKYKYQLKQGVKQRITLPFEYTAEIDNIPVSLVTKENDVILIYDNFKLEEGTKATDWTPAPEDIDSALNNINITVTNLSGEVTATKNQFSTVYTKTETTTQINSLLNPVKTQVNNNSSGITQLNDSLKSYVKSVDYTADKNNIVQRLSTSESNISQLSSQISLTVSKTDYQNGINDTKKYASDMIDNLEIGGRNLIIDSANVTMVSNNGNVGYYPIVNTTTSSGNKAIQRTGVENYSTTLSCYTQHFFPIDIIGDYMQQVKVRPTSDIYLKIYGDNKEQVLCKANIWTTLTRVINFSTIPTDGKYRVWGLVSNNDFSKNNPVIEYKDFKVEKGNKATDYTVAPEDVNTRMDNIVIGGRNILRNSNFSEQGTFWDVNGVVSFETIDGMTVAKITNTTSHGIYQVPPTIDAKKYTISFMAKSVGKTSKIYIGTLGQTTGRSNYFVIGNTWKKYTYTFLNEVDITINKAFHIYSTIESQQGFYITNIKMEVGDKATDWTPALEDTTRAIDNVQQNLDTYKQTVEGAFKDGIITEAESKAIAQQKLSFESEKESLDKQYVSLYNNSILDNTVEKTNLASAKSNYETSYNALIKAINDAILDGRAIASESANVNSKFATYKSNLGVLTTRLEECTDAISTGKVNKINVGTKNLIDSMSMNVNGKGVTGDTKELTMGEWAYRILDNNWVQKKLKSNTTYTISYTVELVSKPTTAIYSGILGRSYIYSATNTTSRVTMAELPSGYYNNMKVGDKYFLKNTFTTPTLSTDACVIFYNAIHGTAPYDQAVMRLHNIMLVEGNTIGDYQRAPEDNEEKLRVMSSKIETNERNINLKVSEEIFNKSQKTLSSITSDLILNTTTGISMTYDGNGVISSHNVGPNGVKIRGEKVDIEGNAVFTSFKNTTTSNNNALTGLKDGTNKINPNVFSNNGMTVINGGNIQTNNMVLNTATLKSATFIRDDGYQPIVSGYIKNDRIVSGTIPMFMTQNSQGLQHFFQDSIHWTTAKNILTNASYQSTGRLDFYSFTHETRYVVISGAVNVLEAGGRLYVRNSTDEIYDSRTFVKGDSRKNSANEVSFRIVLDLGTPDGARRNYYVYFGPNTKDGETARAKIRFLDMYITDFPPTAL